MEEDEKNLPPEKMLEAIAHYEKEIDHLLQEKKISQQQAWEMYFALMYESNMYALVHPSFREQFLTIRERIVSKIDQKKFNPLQSENPEIVAIALRILANHRESHKLN
jgi:hypothetical protein